MKNEQKQNAKDTTTNGKKTGKVIAPRVDAKKVSNDTNKATMFSYFEGTTFNVSTIGTKKKNNVQVLFAENFVKSIANNLAKIDSSVSHTGIYFLNEFRNARFDAKLMSDKKLKYYQGFLNKQYLTELTLEEVKRAIMLGAIKLWNAGNKLEPKRKAESLAVKTPAVIAPETTENQDKEDTTQDTPAVKVSFADFVNNKNIDFNGLTAKSKEYKELKKEYDSFSSQLK